MATFSYSVTTAFANVVLNAATGGTTAGNQSRPFLTYLDSSRFFLTWLTGEEGGANRIETGIYSSSAVSLLSGSILAADTATAVNFAPTAARASDGSITLAWNQLTSGATSIHLAIVNGTNGSITTPDTLMDAAGSHNGRVSITTQGSGVALGYGDNGWPSEEATLARLGAGATTPVFTQINNNSSNRTSDVAVAELSNGNIATVFRDNVTSDMAMRVYTASGAVALNGANPIQRLPFDAFPSNGTPRIAALPNGGFAVVYQDSGWTLGGTAEITLALFDALGNNAAPGGQLFIRVTDNGAEDVDAAVTVDANGLIMVAWTQRNATDDIYARAYTMEGVALSAAPVAVAATAADERQVTLDASSTDTFLFAYQSSNGGTADTDGTAIVGGRYDFFRSIRGDGTDEDLAGTIYRDTISGLGGQDTLSGGAGNDKLSGGDGNDVLRGDAGVDETFGGLGDDQHVLDGGDFAFETTGEGNDTAWIGSDFGAARGSFEIIRLFGAGSSTSLNNATNGAQFVGNAALASTMVGTNFDDVFWGTAQDDRFEGLDGNDVFRAGGGQNTLVGGVGDDQYVIASASDVVVELAGGGTETAWIATNGWVAGANIEIIRLAAPGVTSVTGSASAEDIVANQAEASILFGAGGDDTLWGSTLADILSGGEGNDILRGQGGADQMDGGAGNDQYVVLSASAQLVEASNNGYDTVWLDLAPATNFTLAQNVERGNLGGSATRLFGNTLDNVLVGNPLAGSTLMGGGGNDLMFGSAAADDFTGNSGDDTIYSQGGADVFRYSDLPWGYDQISGFVQGQARLVFTGVSFGQLFLNSANGNTQVEYNGSAVLVFGVASMSAADFVFL